MLAAIKHGLGNLVNFGRRDARQAFWYYVLFVYLVTTALTMVLVVPTMLQAVMAGVRQGIAISQSGDPVAADLAIQATIANSMTGMMSMMVWIGAIANLAMMALLAAAFVRRLHDSDLAGWWALIPGAIQVANVFVAPELMRRMTENISQMQAQGSDPMAGMRAMQGSMASASALGWAGILIIVALGLRKSTPGPNRFGDAPFIA